MSEINIRIANFLKVFSMFVVVVSLAYMYGYVTDKVDFLEAEPAWHHAISKVQIFYAGLATFAIYNLVMNLALGMYKNAQGIDQRSILFKSEHQKYTLLVLFTYMLAGGNIFIATLIFYLTLVKINMVGNAADYIYLPLAGAIILMSILLVLIYRLIKK